jgi:hypothetical protein
MADRTDEDGARAARIDEWMGDERFPRIPCNYELAPYIEYTVP